MVMKAADGHGVCLRESFTLQEQRPYVRRRGAR
jgi:hypothetical protein